MEVSRVRSRSTWALIVSYLTFVVSGRFACHVAGIPSTVCWVIVGAITAALVILLGLELMWSQTGRGGEVKSRGAPERFSAMTLVEVRACADDFDRRSETTSAGVYWLPAKRWRQLERAMRGKGAWYVFELGERDVDRWARRLGIDIDERERLALDRSRIPGRRPST